MLEKESVIYYGKKWLKRILVLTACGAMILPMFGCSKLKQDNLNLNDNKTSDTSSEDDSIVSESTIKLEYMNVANDTDAFVTLDNQLAKDMEDIDATEGLSDDEKKEKKNLATYDFVLNLVQLASTRLSSDIDTVYTHSEDYMNYLALLQSFADSYSEEKQTVQDTIVNGKDASELKTYKALKLLEEYYINIYDSLQSNNDSNSSSSTNSDNQNSSQTNDNSSSENANDSNNEQSSSTDNNSSEEKTTNISRRN